MRRTALPSVLGVALVLGGLVAVAGLGAQEAATRPATRPETRPATREKEPTTVISVAKKGRSLTVFLEALEQSDLIETLEERGPFTLLAPDDEAFEKLPTGTLHELLKEENRDQLKDILLYHVVSGQFNAEQVMKLKELETVEGSPLEIEVSDGKIRLNGRVEVTRTDITADNGVIHVINGVLMPER